LTYYFKLLTEAELATSREQAQLILAELKRLKQLNKQLQSNPAG